MSTLTKLFQIPVDDVHSEMVENFIYTNQIVKQFTSIITINIHSFTCLFRSRTCDFKNHNLRDFRRCARYMLNIYFLLTSMNFSKLKLNFSIFSIFIVY